MDADATALHLQDNAELRSEGEAFTAGFLSDFCKAGFPKLPGEALDSIVGHLSCWPEVAKVARNLGMDDLAMSADVPVPEDVLHATFMAVVGALLQSSGAERARLFLRVGCFLLTGVLVVEARTGVYL